MKYDGTLMFSLCHFTGGGEGLGLDEYPLVSGPMYFVKRWVPFSPVTGSAQNPVRGPALEATGQEGAPRQDMRYPPGWNMRYCPERDSVCSTPLVVTQEDFFAYFTSNV